MNSQVRRWLHFDPTSPSARAARSAEPQCTEFSLNTILGEGYSKSRWTQLLHTNTVKHFSKFSIYTFSVHRLEYFQIKMSVPYHSFKKIFCLYLWEIYCHYSCKCIQQNSAMHKSVFKARALCLKPTVLMKP